MAEMPVEAYSKGSMSFDPMADLAARLQAMGKQPMVGLTVSMGKLRAYNDQIALETGNFWMLAFEFVGKRRSSPNVASAKVSPGSPVRLEF